MAPVLHACKAMQISQASSPLVCWDAGPTVWCAPIEERGALERTRWWRFVV